MVVVQNVLVSMSEAPQEQAAGIRKLEHAKHLILQLLDRILVEGSLERAVELGKISEDLRTFRCFLHGKLN